MSVKDIMTTNVACCTPQSTIQQVARMMVEHDCGEIPVTDSDNRVVGVVTDRDICCRAVAAGANCAEIQISEVMTSPAVCITPDTSVSECTKLMEDNMIRRVPVVDSAGCCCGIVSQADLAERTDGSMLDELLKEISTPTASASKAS
ncbi:MAG TPA: CBS domain-containing protein [Fimbriimonas sp.]|nr:CBS domain-containing protein [Fimbriimonas sp.]